ncbi:MAG: sensor histidine kinase [Prevotella sp.]|nr:sensor histidine kinase [Prevotella sp.]MBR6188262.1 sensor histidine kinase [Prevotella sp.]
MRWYMQLLYILLIAALIYAFMRYRLYRLEKDKHRLETVVQERTADLIEAQHELVRQEKMATVGKLTQGLIDRILNPLNYINNFSKLSESLVNDIKANIEDEKENITPDNYDDTMEVLNMLHGNLQKVGEHGANTARVLKAMEEMLKDRTGGQVNMNLNDLLRHNEKMLHKYYEKEIAEHNISISFSLPADDIHIKGNGELLSMTIMGMLRNAIYAVLKKDLRTQASDLRPQTSDIRLQTSDIRHQTSDIRPQTSDIRPQTSDIRPYQPEVRLELKTSKGKAIITIHDNGIGIEASIIDRIFDPFFTTKTTGEASGVGLYISREIAQNHGGDITVTSVKGEYTEFTITLPLSPLS